MRTLGLLRKPCVNSNKSKANKLKTSRHETNHQIIDRLEGRKQRELRAEEERKRGERILEILLGSSHLAKMDSSSIAVK